MELAWDVIDSFTNAIKLTKGKDIEIEAECDSNIGLIF